MKFFFYKVCEGAISDKDKSARKLVCCLVDEICEDGERTLFHHLERELLDGKKQRINSSKLVINDTKCNYIQNKYIMNNKTFLMKKSRFLRLEIN